MNIFEAGTIVAVPTAAIAGGLIGAKYATGWAIAGALGGGVAGFVIGPLLGLAVLVLAHVFKRATP